MPNEEPHASAINGACGPDGPAARRTWPTRTRSSTAGRRRSTCAGHPQLRASDIGEVAGVGPTRRAGRRRTCRSSRGSTCVIDFSTPEGTMARPADLRGPQDSRSSSPRPATRRSSRREIEAAAHQTAVLFAPNMSLVVNVLFKLVQRRRRRCSRARTSTWRSSSGTTASRRTRRAARRCTSPRSSRRRWARRDLRHGREGLVGERPPHEIGMHAVRVGRQRRRAHDHLQHARRDAGTGPQGPQPRQLRPRGAAGGEVPGGPGRPGGTR